jgi:cell division protein FtsZ
MDSRTHSVNFSSAVEVRSQLPISMNPNLSEPAPVEPVKREIAVRVFGVGTAGLNVIERMMQSGLGSAPFVALNTDPRSLAASSAAQKLQLETPLLSGLGTGGDPERGRVFAEEHLARLKALCEGAQVIFIVAGLGGGAGTGIAPVLARVAKETGALVLGFVMTPFDCEGARRQRLAQQGLEELKNAADGVVCLVNQRVFKLIDQNTSVRQTFQITNELLGDGVRGLWRLLTHTGPIEIHFAELSALLRDRHFESVFAVAEASGAARAQHVLDKLLAHPMLEQGPKLGDFEAVLVSLIGGPDLMMAEIDRIMEHVNRQCEQAQVIMGAAIDENFADRLAVTMVAVHGDAEEPDSLVKVARNHEELPAQLLNRGATAKPSSRILPPAPELTLEKMEEMMARQAASMPRKAAPKVPKLRQTQLPLEIISKGRFDKSEPTIHKGEDLDVPTYIRRGISLN